MHAIFKSIELPNFGACIDNNAGNPERRCAFLEFADRDTAVVCRSAVAPIRPTAMVDTDSSVFPARGLGGIAVEFAGVDLLGVF
ncbi:hypothetical protein [Methylomonas rivi]|uniref:Uncharacterized protein n=1 Tax=Methylomonas rivi TaxID=2952226 RepID=A0ABT1U078_9GAMM|nr:hypothetical protein [Methylomonas sp. WSC-6]MCQ8127214.1 hypothetical protein [Methylomonas sp. WSC-6]